jgi:hypothetical protein
MTKPLRPRAEQRTLPSVSAEYSNNKKRHDAGVHRGVGETKTDLNGQQAHFEKVICGHQYGQQSYESSSAFLSGEFLTKAVYNRKQGESRTTLGRSWLF